MKALVKGGPDEHPIASLAVVLCYMAMCFALCLGCSKKAHAAPPLVVVPVAPAPVQAAPGDAATDDARQQLIARTIIDTVLGALKSRLDKLDSIEARLSALEAKIAARPASSETPPPDQPAGPPDPALPPKWEPAAIIKTHCVSCHGAKRADAGISYDDEGAYIENVLRGYKQAHIGEMPKDRPKLQGAELEAFFQEMLRVIP